MSDRNNVQYTGIDRRLQPPPGVAEPAISPEGDKPNGRHAAISSKLPNLLSYKNWVDKVRGSWEENK